MIYLKILFIIFFTLLNSIVFSQIEVLKTVSISGASFYPGIKDKNKNTYIGLFTSPSISDSVFIDKKFVAVSKGKIDEHNNLSRSQALVIISLDSNYTLSSIHQIYGNKDVNGSKLFLASDSCIYFSIHTFDTVYINEKPIFNSNPQGYTIILKYNPSKDTMIVVKEIFVTGEYNRIGLSEFKEFNGNFYCSFGFQGSYEINGQKFVSGLGLSDYNLFILQIDKNTFEFNKWYYFEGDDEKNINDFLFDQNGILHLTGSFWGSSIISNGDTIRNTTSRSYDGFYFKIDTNKNVIAKKRIGGSNDQFPKQIYLTNEGRVNILGYYNAPYVEVDGVKVINISNSYNIFSLSLDSKSNILSLNQLNKETFIFPYSFSLYSDRKDAFLTSGYFYDNLYIGNGRNLKNPNDKADAFILLMDINCGPMDGYQISGIDYESARIINNGNEIYTIWAHSGSDTTYFVNFDLKYKTGLGQFFMDVRFKFSTGVEEIEKGLKDIEIYPNPSNDFVTIKSFDLNKSMELEIFAIEGKKVYQKEIDISTDEFIFRWPSELKAGIYFYKFKSKNATKVIKVIKQ